MLILLKEKDKVIKQQIRLMKINQLLLLEFTVIKILVKTKKLFLINFN